MNQTIFLSMICALALTSLIPRVLTQCFDSPDAETRPLETASLDSANPIPHTITNDLEFESRRDCSSMCRFPRSDPFACACATILSEQIAVLMNDSYSTAITPDWVLPCIVFSTSVSSAFVHVARCNHETSSAPFHSSAALPPNSRLYRTESNLYWYATAIIPQELISSDSNVNTMAYAFNDPGAAPKHCKETITSHGIEGVILDVLSFAATKSISLRKMGRDKLDLMPRLQEKPTHSSTETRKWKSASHASKPNTTRDNTHPLSIWCDNAHKHQSARVDMKHNQRHETDSIGTDHIPRKMSRSDACSSLKSADIIFILLMIWLTLFGYTRLYTGTIEPPCIDRKQHIRYTHRATTAQSTRRRNKDLYNPIKQITGSVAAALCSVFGSQSRTFKVSSFIALNLLISVRAQYINCTGSYDYDNDV
eukprot:230176_1